MQIEKGKEYASRIAGVQNVNSPVKAAQEVLNWVQVLKAVVVIWSAQKENG